MADKLWKATERWYARLLRGQRNPVALQQKHDGRTLADVTSEELKIAAEIKQSSNPPIKMVRKALLQAEEGKPDGSYNAVAVFHQTHDRHENDIVCMTLKTARRLIPGMRDVR
jgi:hypothetical protein